MRQYRVRMDQRSRAGAQLPNDHSPAKRRPVPAPGRGEAVRRRHPESTLRPDVTAPDGGRPADRDRVRTPRRAPHPRRVGESTSPRLSGAGVTAAGAAVFTLGGTTIGAFVDQLATGGLGTLFAVAFLVATILVAWTVRARDWAAAVIAPPIAFVVSVVIVSTFLGDDADGGYLTRVGIDLVRTLIYKAGLLWGATALAALIVLVKRRARNRS